MTLNLNDHKWPKPVLMTALLLGAALAWLYLAGAVVLVGIGRDYNTATPITYIQYAAHFGDQKRVGLWLWIGAAISTVALLAPIVLFMRPSKRSLHGDARFASANEIKKAGLVDGKGIIVGKKGADYLMFDGPQHVLVSAPTRSGKGVSVVIPNLLTWPQSVVGLDIKRENWDLTSGYRSKYGQRCYLFNPGAADGRTHRYNPLGYISEEPGKRIDDIQKIANMIFPDLQGTDPIWTATPRSLFLGVVLYLLESSGKPVTLGQVLRETLTDGDGKDHFDKAIKDRRDANSPLTGACVRGLQSYTTIASDNTRSGIMTSFRSRLELWMNPAIDAATSANDFDLRDLRKKKMSVFIGITPDNLERMQPLINLFFQQLIDLNTRELPQQNPELKHTCLLLMDEFTAMGKVNILSKGISFIAGYGLRMMPIIQSPAQLVDVYGKDAAQTFQTNHALNIVFPPKASEISTARDISEWLGYTTVKSASKSKNTEIFKRKNHSESVSDQRRALLLPQEITSLGQDAELVVLENTLPIQAKKIRYFADAKFMDRLKDVSPYLAALGKRLPNQAELSEAMRRGELAAPVPILNVEFYQESISAAEGGIERIERPKPATRPFTAEDYPQIAEINFALNFDNIKAPPKGERTVEKLHEFADAACKEVGFHF
ncbi:type IV secretory system conjugative DNA transfer family protein (plasmid) [Acidovorax sp. 210-6]|uniref:type IV secretory system conjugative DNA transfer family protein n=1 Tax=Acidovorax sp. 210-6 TaxID=2699468 RepID=UPI00138A11E5|nr:type IV secretory system conjugative DNA transfer family protein [Acidovorax sp. 210-6]NCU67978.1 type IV secretory system conjugative DNA transfer family protein [Acidovorax sp. 210-6]